VSWTFGIGLYTGQRQPDDTEMRCWYDDLVPLAVAVEDAGFDALWVSEHHGLEDGYLPSPLPALAAVASRTTTLVLGTGLALAPLYHPLRLAEDAAVVDQLSGGRLVLGLGMGYAEVEYASYGVDVGSRGTRMADLLRFLRRAWSGEQISWQGEAIRGDRLRVTPVPRRPGGVPVWVGAYAPGAVRRAGVLADGHIVGRGQPHIIEAATRALLEVRSPEEPSFTRAVNVTCLLDGPGGHAESARSAFAYQQASYERMQSGREVYAGLVADPSGLDLAEGSIDSYVQAAGSAEQLVEQLVTLLRPLAGWANVHVVLRLLFPERDLAAQLERVTAFSQQVLPPLRDRCGR
jgi:alkanesulfonate monooxygenase SsuD/methylene tetrahydromethanopterin reductase-like flavin-dependent oxidoreductase (luciferase family)